MAETYISIRANGVNEVTLKLKGAKARMLDLTAPLTQGAAVMLRSTEVNFRQGGRPTPWRPLAFSTIRRKLAQGYSAIPLTRTGQLRRSIATSVESRRFLVGTAVEYGRYHQFGTRRMPARPFLVFQRQDLQRIERIITKFITEGDIAGA